MLHFRKPRGLQPHAWLITQLLRGFLRSLAKWNVFNVTVTNREVIPARGKVIVACNHISIADPIFLWGAIRRNAVALAMAELWRIPGVNLLMWLLGHIPVKRGSLESGKKALADGIRILEHDGLVIIYPEGKCSKDGTLLRLRTGAAEMAFATEAMVVPAVIKGSDIVKPLHSWRIKRKHSVHLQFGDPIDSSDFTGPNRVIRFTTELRNRLAAMQD